MGTSSAAAADADASMIMVTGLAGAGTGTEANAAVDSIVGVTVTSSTTEKSVEQDCLEIAMFEDGTTDGARLPDLVAESKIYGIAEDEPLESYLAITIQVFIPFLIAGLGMVGAGLVLDLVQVRIRSCFAIPGPTCGGFRSILSTGPPIDHRA